MALQPGRDDSALFSGMSAPTPVVSARTKELQKKRAERTNEKRTKRGQLQPAAEIIVKAFNSEITKIVHGVYEDEDKMTDREFAIERRARRLAVSKLLAAQGQILKLLREPVALQKKPTKEADNFEEMINE